MTNFKAAGATGQGDDSLIASEAMMRATLVSSSRMAVFRLVAIIALVGALLLGPHDALAAGTLAPTMPVTKSPTQAPVPYDPTIGTAFAPTTPGGACLNDHDLALWREPHGGDAKGKNGFELLPVDLQKCSERCALFLRIGSVSVEYNCGGFLSRPPCTFDLYPRCVSDCMARQPVLTESSGFPKLLTPDAYTLPCAECMGNISYCVTQSCFSGCFFGNENPSCRNCARTNCNNGFERCAGFNVDTKMDPPPDYSGVLIGACTGGSLLILSIGILGYRHRMKTRRLRHMSVHELARMADAQARASQGPFSMAIRPPRNDSSSGGAITNAKKLNLSPAMSDMSSKPHAPKLVPEVNVQLTPYQEQYEAQQRMNAINAAGPQPRPAPSMRMQVKASGPVDREAINRGGIPLVMLWSFQAESPDELALEIGTHLVGLEQADGWWLAQTKDGQIGLVPVSYTAHDVLAPKASFHESFNRVAPSTRVSKMRHSVLQDHHMMDMPVIPLMAQYDYSPTHPDEFHLKAGSVVFGMMEQDGWTLVRDESGKNVGLVPSNHVERINAISAPQPLATLPTNSSLAKEPNF